jgi:hypothetical protein
MWLMNFFEADNDENKKNHFLEMLYDLNNKEYIKLDKSQFDLSENTFYFLKLNSADVFNCKFLVDKFCGLMNPNKEIKLDENTENLLINILGNVRGNSNNLALLNDFYGQYLNKSANFKTALKFFELAVEIQSKVGKSGMLMCNYNNHLAETYFMSGDYEKAHKISNQTIEAASLLPENEQIVLAYTYSLIANIYFRQKKHTTAYEYGSLSVEYAIKHKIENLQLVNLMFEAAIFSTKAKKYTEAENFLDDAKRIAHKMPVYEADKKLFEKIKLYKQYISVSKKINKTFLISNNYMLIAVLATIIILILLAVIFL